MLLISFCNDEVKAFNAAFNAKQLNYLFIED